MLQSRQRLPFGFPFGLNICFLLVPPQRGQVGDEWWRRVCSPASINIRWARSSQDGSPQVWWMWKPSGIGPCASIQTTRETRWSFPWKRLRRRKGCSQLIRQGCLVDHSPTIGGRAHVRPTAVATDRLIVLLVDGPEHRPVLERPVLQHVAVGAHTKLLHHRQRRTLLE